MHRRITFAALALAALVGGSAARAEGSPPVPPPVTTAAPPGDGKVNLNTATVEELLLLPGVGPTKAAAIAAFRQRHGPFSRIDELDRVKGFGRKTMARLRPHLSLAGPTTYVGKAHAAKERATGGK
jgi:competence protein ComEA